MIFFCFMPFPVRTENIFIRVFFFGHDHLGMARVAGIEPTLPVLETDVLP